VKDDQLTFDLNELICHAATTEETRSVAKILEERYELGLGPIQRKKLSEETNLDDRQVREAIATLVTENRWPILHAPAKKKKGGGGGYYLVKPTDYSDKRQLLSIADQILYEAAQLTGRITHLSRREKSLRRIAQSLRQRGLFIEEAV